MSERLFQHTKREETCPLCGAALQIKQGGKGPFLACTAYPKCDYLKPLTTQNESKIIKQLAESCPECGHPLVIRQGNYGMFIGCSNYPACRFIVHEEEHAAEEHFPCPECGKGELIPRRGRQGKYFYGCSRFPHCRFTLPTKPYLAECPVCGGPLAVIKKETATRRMLVCVNKACRHGFVQEK
ncbi:topoisomerase DNA-binding C4 zinc finger domain-containing protein [Pasteurellaceae bacterium LIM206]|nr:topoisomerase DNA-binding C4 zinc finger domain-containing protein [Pasteurellaceae bacterium LIM206]